MATIKKIKVRQRFVFPTKNHNEYSTVDTSYTFVYYMHSVYFTISEFRINGQISTVCSSLKYSNNRLIRFSRNESSQDINEPYLRKLVYCTTMTKTVVEKMSRQIDRGQTGLFSKLKTDHSRNGAYHLSHADLLLSTCYHEFPRDTRYEGLLMSSTRLYVFDTTKGKLVVNGRLMAESSFRFGDMQKFLPN